jgi:hypothetical protein
MSKPATIAQSGPVQLPRIRKTATAKAGVSPMLHRVTVGDRLTVMSWERNTYDKITVTEIHGEMVRVTDEDMNVRTMPLTALMFLAGQAAAHHGRGPETPGVGVIYPAAGGAHGITDSGVCVVCCHNH